MRTYLLPIATGLFGLAIIASPAFIPVHLYEAAVPGDLTVDAALHLASIAIVILGASIAAAGLLLAHRRYLRRRAPETGRLETRVATRLIAVAATLALLMAAIIATLTALTAPAFALSLGEMAQEAGEDLEVVPFFISVAFYILGVLIFGFGMIRLKRHMDQPAQTTIGSGLVAVLIGVAFLVAPSVINAVGETFGVDATATLSRPALD